MKLEGGKDYSFLLQAPGQLETLFQSYKVTMKHPVLRLPTAEQVVQTLGLPNGRQLLEQGLEQREKLIKLMVADPYRYGYEPHPPHCTRKCWDDARRALDNYRLLMISTRNRNTKSEFAGKEVVRRLMQPNKKGEPQRWWCLCQDNNTSIRGGGQQELIWKYLPPEVKALNGKRTDDWALNYTAKNRFTDNAFLIPTPHGVAECRFMNYEQKMDMIEGGNIDGFWADELIPVEWLVTLMGRLIDRDGHGLSTFTPIRGWSEAYALVFQGCKVLETQEFPLFRDMKHWPGLPPGQIPYLVEAVDPRYAGMFFPPDANPYVPFDALVREWSSANYEVKMIRLAGIAKKGVGNRFPKFGKPHIIPASQVPAHGTNYHVMDFAEGRNWYQLWARVTRDGRGKRRVFIYREWPDKPTYGEWAVRSGKPNGAIGPAQAQIGLGYKAYRDLIYQLEGGKADPITGFKIGGEVIFQRLGDPRSGKAPVITQEAGGTCNIDEMMKVGVEIAPAKGLHINEGVSKLNAMLDYDQEQYEQDGGFTPLNEPEMFISEACQNLIDCAQLWTGQGSEKEQASKDPIDDWRYLATEDLDDVPALALGSEGGGAY